MCIPGRQRPNQIETGRPGHKTCGNHSPTKPYKCSEEIHAKKYAMRIVRRQESKPSPRNLAWANSSRLDEAYESQVSAL